MALLPTRQLEEVTCCLNELYNDMEVEIYTTVDQ
jgi:hypothetical protein